MDSATQKMIDDMKAVQQSRCDAAASMDDDKYHGAMEPEYVLNILETCEGACILDAPNAHKEMALAAVMGMARRTMIKMVEENKRLRDALVKLSCLGNRRNLPGNSEGNLIAIAALDQTSPKHNGDSQ